MSHRKWNDVFDERERETECAARECQQILVKALGPGLLVIERLFLKIVKEFLCSGFICHD